MTAFDRRLSLSIDRCHDALNTLHPRRGLWAWALRRVWKWRLRRLERNLPI